MKPAVPASVTKSPDVLVRCGSARSVPRADDDSVTGVNSVSVGDASIAAVVSTSSGGAGARPEACRNAGSRYRVTQTSVETGLPGSAKIGLPRALTPNHIGRPGRCSTL